MQPITTAWKKKKKKKKKKKQKNIQQQQRGELTSQIWMKKTISYSGSTLSNRKVAVDFHFVVLTKTRIGSENVARNKALYWLTICLTECLIVLSLLRTLAHNLLIESVFQNLPHSYTWPSKKRTHSYTWSRTHQLMGPRLDHPKCWPIHILPFDFLSPFFAGYYTNITVNSCNTKRISSLEKSLSEKYVHIPGCQKNGAFHIGIQKNRAIHILFVEKKGASHIPGSAEKGGYSARTSVLCHI